MTAPSIIAWVLSGLLALVFLGSGGNKIVNGRGKEPLPPLQGYSDTQVRLIGVAEVLGAIGLILPELTGILPWLTPLAAAGLALIQLLATFAHRKHKEPFIFNIVLMLIAIAIIVMRLMGV